MTTTKDSAAARDATHGAAPGYAPGHTLTVRVELARQLKRRRTLVMAALLAALLWIVIGVVQRTRAGLAFADALVAELPLAAVVFVIALVWARLRNPPR